MRKSFLTVLPVFVMALMLSGCIAGLTASKFSPEKVNENLVPGVTTKEQVREIYGEPTEIKTSKKGDTWIYVDEPSESERTAGNLFGQLAPDLVDSGSEKLGTEVTKSHGSVAGSVAGSAASEAGYATTDAVVAHANRETTTLTIKFDKAGVVSTFDLESSDVSSYNN